MDFVLKSFVAPLATQLVVQVAIRLSFQSIVRRKKYTPQQAEKLQWLLQAAGFLVQVLVAILPQVVQAVWTDRQVLDRGRGAYGILGVSASASTKDIGRAFRQLSLVMHPDKVGGETGDVADAYKRMADAHGILRVPEIRASYDRFGAVALQLAGKRAADKDTFLIHMLKETAAYYVLQGLWTVFALLFQANAPLSELNLSVLVLGFAIESSLRVSGGGWATRLTGLPAFQLARVVKILVSIFMLASRRFIKMPTTPLDRQIQQLNLLVSDVDKLATAGAVQSAVPFANDTESMARLQKGLQTKLLHHLQLKDPEVAQKLRDSSPASVVL